jgi:hypothetical protein
MDDLQNLNKKLDQIIELLKPLNAHFAHLESIRNVSFAGVEELHERAIKNKALLNEKT